MWDMWPDLCINLQHGGGRTAVSCSRAAQHCALQLLGKKCSPVLSHRCPRRKEKIPAPGFLVSQAAFCGQRSLLMTAMASCHKKRLSCNAGQQTVLYYNCCREVCHQT